MTEDHDGCIYLDYNATTPIWPEVAEAMEPYLTKFGNPSSTSHAYGRAAKEALELARWQVAELIGARPDEIFFTSCGTESDNWAIWSAAMTSRRRDPSIIPHVVASEIEHPAVLNCLISLKALGLLDFTTIPVTKEGIVETRTLEQAIIPGRTVLITVMHSNNETGALQPVHEITRVAQTRGVLMHTDAAQSIGKVPVDVTSLDIDMMTIVGHKFGAPKGVAALYCRKSAQSSLGSFLFGGGQELGCRAGTENVMLIAGLGKAAEIARNELHLRVVELARLRDDLQRRLQAAFPVEQVRINGPVDPALRLPNTLSIAIRGVQADSVLKRLGDKLAASAGAACHTEGGSVSGVLKAMGVQPEWAIGTMRLSVGRGSTPEDVAKAAELIVEACRNE